MKDIVQKNKSFSKQLLIYSFTILVLLLTAFNIQSYTSQEKVLGTNIESNQKQEEIDFWLDFLEKNPTYIPGWIEIGRLDKVKEIDPNYFLEP